MRRDLFLGKGQIKSDQGCKSGICDDPNVGMVPIEVLMDLGPFLNGVGVQVRPVVFLGQVSQDGVGFVNALPRGQFQHGYRADSVGFGKVCFGSGAVLFGGTGVQLDGFEVGGVHFVGHEPFDGSGRLGDGVGVEGEHRRTLPEMVRQTPWGVGGAFIVVSKTHSGMHPEEIATL